MADEEEVKAALQEMDATLVRLQKIAANNVPYAARCNAEKKYGEAYQVLVRMGLRPRLRAKYRCYG